MEYKESLNQTQARYTNELDGLKDQIQESEASRETLEQEVTMLREKIERLRLESMTESEETIGELSRMHDREKILLIEDNKRLVSEMEKVISFIFEWLYGVRGSDLGVVFVVGWMDSQCVLGTHSFNSM